MKIQEVSPNEIEVKIASLKKKGYTRVNSISGVDSGENIDVIYHISKSGKDVLNIKTAVPKKKPEINTVSKILPGAVLFERELSEMLGVKVIGNEFERLFLPENWPKGKYPLRKEVVKNA
jgi:NADH-quinone oxidoreductase subunit C